MGTLLDMVTEVFLMAMLVLFVVLAVMPAEMAMNAIFGG